MPHSKSIFINNLATILLLWLSKANAVTLLQQKPNLLTSNANNQLFLDTNLQHFT